MARIRVAAEVIGQILQQKGLQAGLRRGQALALWPQIAGPALSGLSQAERLEDGVLFVRVTDAVVAHQLTYLREAFVQRYQEKLPGVVRELRFQVGLERKPRPQPQPSPRPPLSPEEEDRLRALAEQAPPELREAILRAGKAVLQRQKESPHPPCPICHLPSPEHPCPSCQKLLHEPIVLREATRLSRFPLKPCLEGHPLEAARYLARSRLEAQLRELLPQVIQQPDLIPILQDTARRYLQLCTGQPEVRTYRHLLPPSLQSLLKEV